jgi:vacuolar-type H+-ATPase subunit I/STV1
MTFSLCLSYINAKHFKTPIEIWANFVPGMIFFQSIFGYLVFAIVFKWSNDWYGTGRDPPSLLNMLIFMFLSPGKIEAPLFPYQAALQTVLLLLALVCVPILLFLKPFYLRHEHNKARAQGYRGLGDRSRVSALDDDDDEGHTLNGGRDSLGDDDEGAAIITQDVGHGEHEEFEFSEVMIHQVIHTIGKFRSYPLSSRLTFDRILSQLRFAHCFISSSLGLVSCPSTAVDCAVDHDPRQCLCHDWHRRSHCNRHHVWNVVCVDSVCAVYHGGYKRYASQFAFTLGGSNEQAFYRRRYTVSAIFL